MAQQLFSSVSTDTTSSTVHLYQQNHTAWLVTGHGKGDWDGAQLKMQLSPTGAAASWNPITSAALSADGNFNVWVADDMYLHVYTSAASTSTSIDFYIATGAHTR